MPLGLAAAAGVRIVVPDDADGRITVDPVTGDEEQRNDDGSTTIRFGGRRSQRDDDADDAWYRNLYNDIDPSQLGLVAEELIEGIDADDRSRQGYLTNLDRGMDYLGLELREPRATAGDGADSVEGMSSVVNPLLLEACLKAWANSVGEFLPANGPVKIDAEGEDVSQVRDDLAEVLERDLNWYFTRGATEYYPETSHMLLWGVHFGGAGFKKVYRCPLRRRPVSEAVSAQDLIVSNTTKDLRSSERVTHRIRVSRQIMKRMQLIGAYADVALTQPVPTPTVVDEKVAIIQGTRPRPERPEDQEYEGYETQCLLDLPQFAAATKFRGEHLPLPYLVTIDKDSRKVLAIRRDWAEDDAECMRNRMWVKWPYVPGPGFYGTGLLHMLGNSSAAMTAAWREALDAGMYASFPGGFVSKSANRQNTSMFRAAPGQWLPLDTEGKAISQMAMAFPYRDATPGLMSMIEQVTTQSKGLSGSIEVPTQSGVQNVPVGTMMAAIEQVTKVMLATHQGMHGAQAEELELVTDLFRAHPEDFWRTLPRTASAWWRSLPVQAKAWYREQYGSAAAAKQWWRDLTPDGTSYWNDEKLLAALEDVSLAPRSDPNTPSHIHRVARALALVQLVEVPPFAQRLDMDEVLRRVLMAIREDPAGLQVKAPDMQPPPDLKGMADMITARARQDANTIRAADLQQKQGLDQQKQASQQVIEDTRLRREEVIHQGDMLKTEREAQLDMAAKAQDQQQQAEAHAQQMEANREQAALDRQQAVQDAAAERDKAATGLAVEHAKAGLAVEAHGHQLGLRAQEQYHREALAEEEQLHRQALAERDAEHQRGLAEDKARHERRLAERRARTRPGGRS